MLDNQRVANLWNIAIKTSRPTDLCFQLNEEKHNDVESFCAVSTALTIIFCSDRIRSLSEIIVGHSQSWGEQAFSSPKDYRESRRNRTKRFYIIVVFFIKLEAEICRPQCLYGNIPQIGNTLVVQDRGRLFKISSRIVLSACGRALSRKRQRF